MRDRDGAPNVGSGVGSGVRRSSHRMIDVAVMMLEGWRVDPAKYVLREIQKVLAKAVDASSSEDVLDRRPDRRWAY